jgi:hypothetical protein
MAQIRDFYDYDFRDHFKDAYAGTGYTYGDVEAAYRYGYDLAYGCRYRNRGWGVIEREARHDWEKRHRCQPWEDVRDAVRHSWETVRSHLEMPEPWGFLLRK